MVGGCWLLEQGEDRRQKKVADEAEYPEDETDERNGEACRQEASRDGLHFVSVHLDAPEKGRTKDEDCPHDEGDGHHCHFQSSSVDEGGTFNNKYSIKYAKVKHFKQNRLFFGKIALWNTSLLQQSKQSMLVLA